MRVELIGGPKDGEIVDIPEGRRDYRILRPRGPLFVGAQQQPSDMPIPIEYGIYTARTHAPGFVPRELYWWGWHS
jgi:hypothetical protein